jgi:hypothetical protein
MELVWHCKTTFHDRSVLVTTFSLVSSQNCSFLKVRKAMTGIQIGQAQTVCCPNCGQPAERQLLPLDEWAHGKANRATADLGVRTECRACDYVLVTSSDLMRVIESYAPGRRAGRSPQSQGHSQAHSQALSQSQGLNTEESLAQRVMRVASQVSKA